MLFKYIILVGGIVNLLLIWFQISSGRQWIKVPLTVHRKTGTLLVITGTIHGAVALLVNFL